MKPTPRHSHPFAGNLEAVYPSSLRILVIDDNEDAAVLLTSWLVLLGHEVVTAYNGRDAIAAFAREDFHLVVTDIGMPGMDGLETARRIRRLPGGAAAYVVALSGWGSAEDKVRSLTAGIDLHLVKPAEPQQLDLVLNAVRKGQRSDDGVLNPLFQDSSLQRKAH